MANRSNFYAFPNLDWYWALCVCKKLQTHTQILHTLQFTRSQTQLKEVRFLFYYRSSTWYNTDMAETLTAMELHRCQKTPLLTHGEIVMSQ